MGKNDNNSTKENTEKIADLKNEKAELQAKVESFEDPNAKPRVVRKGFVKTSIKFQKNKTIINPCPNPEPEPIPAK